jgi:hypothetical protein
MTMRPLLALPLALLLTGCPLVKQAKPVPALIDATCFQSVVDYVRWEGDPNDPKAWDNLAGETVPALREKVGTADNHREACVMGLKRLEKLGVIDLGR